MGNVGGKLRVFIFITTPHNEGPDYNNEIIPHTCISNLLEKCLK
jgi:hypothetical protein